MGDGPLINGLRRRGRWLAPAAPTPDPPGERAVDFAWRVHGLQANWASHADVKASILLVLEGGALYAVVSALSGDGFLTRLDGRAGLFAFAITAGIGALLLAIGAAALAIFPRLGPGQKADRASHAIYFGDLRRRSPAELRGHLGSLTEDVELEMLSQQLTSMACRNWVKHRWVQISLILSLTGILIIAVSSLVSAST
jgi:hypothetical protein